MRILVATDQWFPDFKGGSARVAAETARGLALLGHDVTVLAPHHPAYAQEEREGQLTVRRVLRRYGIPQTFADVVAAYRAVRRDPVQYDVLVAHQATIAAGLAAARLNAPLVLVYHASARRELRFARSRAKSPLSWLTMRALAGPVGYLDTRAIQLADAILVLSRYTRSLISEDHPQALAKVEVVSGGVDTTAFSPGDGATAARARLGIKFAGTLIVAVRRLEPRMGLESLIAAMPFLQNRDVRLAIVGGGSLRARLHRLASELGVGRLVLFPGIVPEEALVDWYRAADVAVVPTVAYEGFGLATAEALACGTPVVGTPVGATQELLEPLDPRLVSRAVGPEALAEAIRVGLDLCTPTFQDACRRHALRRLDWNRVISAWEHALSEAARHGASPTSAHARKTGRNHGH